MEFKINIGDPKTGKTVQKVVSGKEAEAFLKKRVGEKISGEAIGFPGYEFEITGGSDYCGFPMRRDVRGTARKRVLIVSGVGIRKNVVGRKVRKTVAGNVIYSRTAQINLKVLKQGEQPLVTETTESKKDSESSTELKKKEGEAEAKEEKAVEKKEDKAAEKRASEKLAVPENLSFLKKQEKAKAREEKAEEKKPVEEKKEE